jgi:hypothetical protein
VPGLAIERDAKAVGSAEWEFAIPANTGEHTVTATAPQRRAFRTKVTVTGEGRTSEITVPALAEAPDEGTAPKPGASGGLGTQRTIALVAGGVGLVGVGLGTYFTLQSKSKHDETDRLCGGSPACPTQAGVDASNDARSLGNLATVSMIVGGVGLASGLALWLTAPSRESEPSARVGLGFGTVDVRGTW